MNHQQHRLYLYVVNITASFKLFVIIIIHLIYKYLHTKIVKIVTPVSTYLYKIIINLH